jgi:hypothetical protein
MSTAPISSALSILGFDEIHVHNAGNQTAFIKAFGDHVIPNLKWNNV